jgi:hypothetical protein
VRNHGPDAAFGLLMKSLPYALVPQPGLCVTSAGR